MSPKMGQKLTDNPRNVRLEIRLTEHESKKLSNCAEKLNTTKTDIIVQGIDLVSKKLEKK